MARQGPDRPGGPAASPFLLRPRDDSLTAAAELPPQPEGQHTGAYSAFRRAYRQAFRAAEALGEEAPEAAEAALKATLPRFLEALGIATRDAENSARFSLGAMLGDLIPEDHLDATGICRVVEPLLRERYSAAVAAGLIPKPGNLMEPIRNGLAYRRVERGADFREGGRAAEALLAAAANDPKPEPKPVRKRLVDLEDLENEPPPQWIVPNAIPADGVTVVYGPPKAGKSLIVADLAASMAAGTAWCDRVPVEREGTVVFFALEARRPTAARLQAWKKARGADTRRRLKFADASLLLGDNGPPKPTDVAAALREDCGETPALVVVDTWAHLMGLWGLDENKTAEQNVAAKWWERFAEALGAPVIIVAHSGKEDRGIRGSNALEATAAAVLGVEIERRTVRIRTRAMRSAELGWQMVAAIGEVDGQPVLTGLTADMSEDEEDFPDTPVTDVTVGPDDSRLKEAIVETLDALARRGLADAKAKDVVETVAAKVAEGERGRRAAAERAEVILRRADFIHNGRCDVLPGADVRERIGRKNE